MNLTSKIVRTGEEPHIHSFPPEMFYFLIKLVLHKLNLTLLNENQLET